MDQEAKHNAGNGDWPASEDIVRRFDSATASLEDLDRRVRPYIAAHPFVAVGLAAAAGFLLGRLLSRS